MPDNKDELEKALAAADKAYDDALEVWAEACKKVDKAYTARHKAYDALGGHNKPQGEQGWK